MFHTLLVLSSSNLNSQPSRNKVNKCLLYFIVPKTSKVISMSIEKDFIWVESLRPKNIDECILPQRIKDRLNEMVNKGVITNYTGVGSPGSGKSSSARALCEQLGVEYLLINMSNESGIDTIRNKVINFASSSSLDFGDNGQSYKVIILDEMDHSSNQAQASLRGVIEEFQHNCRFILTANYKTKIMSALFSRCPPLEFEFVADEKREMCRQFHNRMMDILDKYGIAYDKLSLMKFIIAHFPDFRCIINQIQMSIKENELNLDGLGADSKEKIENLEVIMKNKDFGSLIKWVDENANGDYHNIRNSIYEYFREKLTGEMLAVLIMTLNKYDYQDSFVIDKNINMLAFLTELMNDEVVS